MRFCIGIVIVVELIVWRKVPHFMEILQNLNMIMNKIMISKI